MWGRKIGFSGAKKVWSALLLQGQRWVPEAELRLNEKVFSLLFFFLCSCSCWGGEQAAGRTVQDQSACRAFTPSLFLPYRSSSYSSQREQITERRVTRPLCWQVNLSSPELRCRSSASLRASPCDRGGDGAAWHWVLRHLAWGKHSLKQGRMEMGDNSWSALLALSTEEANQA